METADTVQDASNELIVGYVPAFRSIDGWRLGFRQHRPANDGGVARRVVYDNIEDPHRRLLVDVIEFPGPSAAAKKLAAARKEAKIPTIDAPSKFGPGAFTPQQNNALSLYFRQSNLMIWVFSCARESVYVGPWADQIQDDLNERQTTEVGDDLTLTAMEQSAPSAKPIRLSVWCRWDRGNWAWRKFKAAGGKMARSLDDESVLFWPSESSASMTCWQIEPGRATYAGRFDVPKIAQ